VGLLDNLSKGLGQATGFLEQANAFQSQLEGLKAPKFTPPSFGSLFNNGGGFGLPGNSLVFGPPPAPPVAAGTPNLMVLAAIALVAFLVLKR
jgi:hypothetical protein